MAGGAAVNFVVLLLLGAHVVAHAQPPQHSCPAFVRYNHILRHLKRRELRRQQNPSTYTADLRVLPLQHPQQTQ